MIAIIAEYNPFHNGHIYQLNYIKKHFPGEKILVVLAGKYVQRGEIAVASFAKRKRAALAYGADRVVKLPFKYATQAAHIFAEGAVATALKFGAKKLIFGSESNDIATFLQIAELMQRDAKSYQDHLKHFLKQGNAFPKAASLSLKLISNHSFTLPNDILGLEYVKVIVFQKLPLQPFTMLRTIGFDAQEPKNHYASASLIRQKLANNESVAKYTPLHFPKKQRRIEDLYPRFQKIIRRTDRAKLARITLVSEGIENLFKKQIDAPSYQAFVARTTSRRYTASRIKRTILYILLNITK